MASVAAMERMREEATCSICLSLMAKPLSISCGHSFCQGCIEGILDNLSHQQPNLQQYPCPLCQVPFDRTSLRPNKQLGNIIEAMTGLSDEVTCKEHGKELHVFCKDDSQLICWRCAWSPRHKGHTTELVEDAYQGYKEELQEAETYLRGLEEERRNQEAVVTEQITKWNRKVEIQRKKIQDDFKDFHRFLQEKEKSYLRKLEQENEKTLKALKESEASLEEKRCEFERHMQDVEDRCQGSAREMLQDVEGTLSRIRAVKLQGLEVPSLEIQTVYNVSQLYFDMRKLLRGDQVEMIPGPETAHPDLILPEGQRQVTLRNWKREVHDSPKRSATLACVMGCKGLTSGRHYFEVFVGKGTEWELGFHMENVQRNRYTLGEPQSGFWLIRLCPKAGYKALTSPPTSLYISEPPRLVGAFLDYEAGAVSFYDMITAARLFTFPRASFSGKLRPCFWVYPSSSLSLPPPNVQRERQPPWFYQD